MLTLFFRNSGRLIAFDYGRHRLVRSWLPTRATMTRAWRIYDARYMGWEYNCQALDTVPFFLHDS
jgi:hypothetical protein